MGNKMAPASRKPHNPCAKQVKMCVNHAATQANPNSAGIICAPQALRLPSGMPLPQFVGKMKIHRT